jgi:hypothetical protein
LPCSNKDALCRKSGVVRPGKHAGVKRPLFAFVLLDVELSIFDTFISVLLTMLVARGIVGFKMLVFIGDDEATLLFFLIRLSI